MKEVDRSSTRTLTEYSNIILYEFTLLLAQKAQSTGGGGGAKEPMCIYIAK